MTGSLQVDEPFPALHRAILGVDIEGFADRRRTNLDQVAMRDGLYRCLRTAFAVSGIDWTACYCEDRGDGALILVPPEVPKSLLVVHLPEELSSVLRSHNEAQAPESRIRVRLVVHAGEVHRDDYGVAGTAINVAFRLLEAGPLKRALSETSGPVAVIASQWFFEEVIRHTPASWPATYRQVRVQVKETDELAWIRLPGSTGIVLDGQISGQVAEGAGESRQVAIRTADLTQAIQVTENYQRTRAHSQREAAVRSLPRDVVAFTGRARELEQLTSAAGRAGVVVILAVDGMPGVGKTALVTRAAHLLAGRFPDGQLFIPLHAHTPGRRPAEPTAVLAALLASTGMGPREIPSGLDARVHRWRDRLAGKRMMLILDDAAGRAQIEPLLPGTPGCLVLVTSRRRLVGFDGAEPLSLDTLPADQAALLFIRLVNRAPPAELETGAVAALVRLCGHLPLAVALAAGRLAHHPAWSISWFTGELASAQDRLAELSAGDRAVAAAFELSYRDLPAGQQRLFRRLGLHPGTDFDAYAAAILDEIPLAAARAQLDALYTDHLIEETFPGRYRMHDLIRAYAQALAAGDPVDARGRAVDELLDYYQYAAETAGRHFARATFTGPPIAVTPPPAAPDLATSSDALAWMRAEQPNLLACLDYAVAHREHHRVVWLTAAMAPFLRQEGPWGQAAILYHTAAAAAHHVGDPTGEANNLWALGDMRYLTGDYLAAASLLEQAVALYHSLGDRLGEANSLHDLGHVRYQTGDYTGAASLQERALGLSRALGYRLGEANSLHDLGRVRYQTGDYTTAASLLDQALVIYKNLGKGIGAATSLQDLGRVRYQTGDYIEAAGLQNQALDLYRGLGSRIGEAIGLCELGRLHHLTGDYAAAAQLLDRALTLYQDLGYRLGEAEVLNVTGKLVAESVGPREALELHRASMQLARQIHSPLEEARALEGAANCQLHAGERTAALADLREAVAIYTRIGVPAAKAAKEFLRSLKGEDKDSATI